MSDPTARALRRRLVKDGFVPAPAVVDAAGTAGLPRSPLAQAAAFAAEVEAFAATFWVLDPPDRRRRWLELTARGFGPAVTRLADLAPGLAVVPVPHPDPAATELAGLIRKLFTLAPAARAARRLTWLRAVGRCPEWAAAARTVLHTDPDLTRLEPRLFDWYSRNLVPTPVPADPNAPERGDEWPRDAVYSPAPMAKRLAAPAHPHWWAGVLGAAAVAITAGRMMLSGNDLPADPADPSAYQPPAHQRRDQPFPGDLQSPPERPITLAEVAALVEYERAVADGAVGPGTPPPGRYDRWVRLGRPTRVIAP